MNSSKKNKALYVIVGAILLTAIVLGGSRYLFSAPTKAADTAPEFIGQAQEFSYLVTDDLSFWVNKVVQLTGQVSEVTEDGVLINGTIYCQFDNPAILKTIAKNQSLTIKGKMVGFDELLMEIKLSQCIIP